MLASESAGVRYGKLIRVTEERDIAKHGFLKEPIFIVELEAIVGGQVGDLDIWLGAYLVRYAGEQVVIQRACPNQRYDGESQCGQQPETGQILCFLRHRLCINYHTGAIYCPQVF